MAQQRPRDSLPLADPVETLTNPTYDMLTKAIGHLEDKLARAKAVQLGIQKNAPGFTYDYLRSVTETTTLEMRIAALQAYQKQQASIAFLGVIAMSFAVDQTKTATSVDAGHGD